VTLEQCVEKGGLVCWYGGGGLGRRHVAGIESLPYFALGRSLWDPLICGNLDRIAVKTTAVMPRKGQGEKSPFSSRRGYPIEFSSSSLPAGDMYTRKARTACVLFVDRELHACYSWIIHSYH
jgi:hypothetical protein